MLKNFEVIIYCQTNQYAIVFVTSLNRRSNKKNLFSSGIKL